MKTDASIPIFSKDVTLFAKGVAICFLLWHHLFMRTMDYGLLVNKTAGMGKACIGIFVFLAGYGAAASLARPGANFIQTGFSFIRHRLTKFYPGYWLIFLIFVPASIFIFGNTPEKIFPNGHAGWKMLAEFLGMLGYFDPSGYNNPDWFVGAIVPLWIAAPVLVPICRKTPVFAVLFGFGCLYLPALPALWVLPFCCGIVFQQRDLFRKISVWLLHRHLENAAIVFSVALMLFAFFERNHFPILSLRNERLDAITAISVVLFSYFAFPVSRIIRNIFCLLGKHSMNMYLIHEFIRSFLGSNTYMLRNPILVFLQLLVISLLASAAVTKFQSAISRFIITKVNHFHDNASKSY